MLNNYKALLMPLCLCALGASAQNVTVVLKDGTTHKFCTDYVKGLTFVETQQKPDVEQLTAITIHAYSGGNATIKLANADSSIELELDTYGPKDAEYLNPGTYTVDSTCDPWTVDNGYYSSATINGNQLALSSGTMTVSREEKVYTIDVDLVLSDSSEVKAQYVGELPTYGPYISYTLSAMSYNSNPMAAGEFYVKGNDADWNIEMAVDFFADAAATTLPDGTYTYATTKAAGTFGPSSYVDLYNPTRNCRMTEGSEITVSTEGSNRVINMNLKLDSGLEAEITFTGEITGTPAFEAPLAKGMKKSPVRTLNRK